MYAALPQARAQVARETATLDQLSRGRLTLGVGLGANSGGELDRFGETVDPRERAQRLDQGLDQLAAMWEGEFEPRPVQSPRIPVWVAARWPHRRPVERAARWDGIFPIELTHPDDLAEISTAIGELRTDTDERPFDLVVDLAPGADPEPWGRAGATWILTDFGPQPTAAHVRDVIRQEVR